MPTAIKVENLGKKYLVNHENTNQTNTLRDEIANRVNSIFRTKEKASKQAEEFWALKDVSFSINQGERVGIVGRNGAGKSTLLKILSRITAQSTGKVSIKGRVASLLEVGTGFHPELTGRENIFLNGAILGLRRGEIKAKFDEIVEFSEISKFLDTPVKWYSSGMYARLAFSVAAHLEPDVLIIDEVLAVGDAQFQKKCLGKLSEVSDQEGRTVLFVSHNLQAVQNMCTRALLLESGKLVLNSHPKEVVYAYIKSDAEQKLHKLWETPETAPGNDSVRMRSIKVSPHEGNPDDVITVNTPIQIDFEFWSFVSDCQLNVNFKLYTITGECVFDLGSPLVKADKGIFVLTSIIPSNLLNNATYTVSLTVVKNASYPIYNFYNCISFEVMDNRDNMDYYGPWPGIIRPQITSWLYLHEPISQIS